MSVRSDARSQNLCGRVAAAAVAAALCLPSSVALAQATVSGGDHYLGSGGSDSIDMVMIKGDAGDTVYCKVTANEADGSKVVVADRLAYTLNESDKDANGDLTAVMSSAGQVIHPDATYTVEVFATRDEVTPLYVGTMTPVLAQLDGVAGSVIIGYQTKSDAEASRTFNAPETVSCGADTFALKDQDPVNNVPLTFAYELENDAAADSESGSITYVDADGNVLLVDPIEDIKKGQTVTADVRQLFPVTAGGATKYYRSVYFNKQVDASFPGKRDFVVPCVEVSAEAATKAGFHTAQINFVDEKGNVLDTDRVTVAGTVNYTAPSLFYKGEGNHVQQFTLSADQELTLGEKNVLELTPTTDGVKDGVKQYNIRYDSSAKTGSFTWAVVLVNGDADPRSPERTIGSETIKVVEGKGPAVYNVEDSVDIDGVTYVPAAGTPASYSFQFGGAADNADPVQYVYYVPKDARERDSYDVTINYVDYMTGAVLKSDTHEVDPNAAEDYYFTSDKSFVQGSVTYERLDGQDAPIRHGFFSPNRTYTVYYHDASQPLTHGEVIRHVQVAYVDGGVVYVPGATRYVDGPATDGGTTDNGTTTRPGAGVAATAINAEAGVTSVETDDGTTLVNNEGQDLNTERIEDEQTPLAAAPESDHGVATRNAGLFAVIAAAIAAFVFFLVHGRRRKDDSDQSQNAE